MAEEQYELELDVPEPEYEIETFDTTEESGCDGGACKI